MGEIERVLVIGAGTMGHGVAQVAAAAGFEVLLNDVSEELVELAHDRLNLWLNLKEMAGLAASEGHRGVVEAELEEEMDKKLDALRAEYETKIADLKMKYPQVVARRLAEGLLKAGNGKMTVGDLLKRAQSTPRSLRCRPRPPRSKKKGWRWSRTSRRSVVRPATSAPTSTRSCSPTTRPNRRTSRMRRQGPSSR